jgi:hypothetical protein
MLYDYNTKRVFSQLRSGAQLLLPAVLEFYHDTTISLYHRTTVPVYDYITIPIRCYYGTIPHGVLAQLCRLAQLQLPAGLNTILDYYTTVLRHYY